MIYLFFFFATTPRNAKQIDKNMQKQKKKKKEKKKTEWQKQTKKSIP